MSIIRNDRSGNWAFGISKSADTSQLMVHFAVWHLCFHIKEGLVDMSYLADVFRCNVTREIIDTTTVHYEGSTTDD